MESLAWMDGVVDVYMPDFKVWTKASGIRYLKAKDYADVARRTITRRGSTVHTVMASTT
jgi:putative pyruvate formate lyase activating enzyme